MNYKVKPIGKFEAVDGSLRIRVYPEYRDAMTGPGGLFVCAGTVVVQPVR